MAGRTKRSSTRWRSILEYRNAQCRSCTATRAGVSWSRLRTEEGHMKTIAAAILALGISMNALPVVQTDTVEYKQGDATLEGYLAYDPGASKRPGVLVVHDWMGVGPFVKGRAEELARMGYIAFAADIYGKGVRPKNPKEAGELAGN